MTRINYVPAALLLQRSGKCEKNMTSARELAGDNWDDDDQPLLQSYLDKQ